MTKPFILTIFGASGDLAKIKLFPSIYILAERNLLPKDFYIVGYARTKKDKKTFEKEFVKAIRDKIENVDKEKLKMLTDRLSYVSGQYDKKDSYTKLVEHIDNLSGACKMLKIMYLSVPPSVFKSIIKNLGGQRKEFKDEIAMVIEKPFGGDVISANSLYYFIVRYFNEEQIYLLDHYLGKQAVRSILHLRHHNRILNSMLKGREVTDIQITAIEDIGIENRVGYFDQVGIIRDMIQSHLLQILALVTMSIPITERASAIHREKENIISSITFPRTKNRVILGQYETYKNLPEVPKSSNTETFAALRLLIDRESWYKVPIYIRTGKKLYKKYTSVVVTLNKFPYQRRNEEPNRVIFELYPDEKISITMINKYGQDEAQELITPEHSLACSDESCLPEHASLLLDVTKQERKYFLSFPEIIASWKVVDKIFCHIKKNKVKVEKYKDNKYGPDAQHLITRSDNVEWFDVYKKEDK